MPIRVSWDKYEVALLFRAYKTVIGGSDINEVARSLSETLRKLAIQRGIEIDDTYRNVNGMKMQLSNVLYLFTNGEKGLSGASSLTREMYQMYQQNQADYQEILKGAIQLTGEKKPVEEAFFDYAKEKTNLSDNQLAEYLKKASDYCHLKKPLLGMTDVIAVRDIQKKIAEGKLLRFRFGKDAQLIRNVTQLYYSFVKTYRAPKPEEPVQHEDEKNEVATEEMKINQGFEDTQGAETADKKNSEGTIEDPASSSDAEETIADGQLLVDFSQDATYLFTKPVHYVYRGKTCGAKSWNSLYAELCGALFADYHDQFMSIMNGDVPEYRALAFADEQHKEKMRVARQFAQGYYLESNMDATSIVRRIRGLYQLFNLGEELSIVYRRTNDGNGQKPQV